MAIHYITKPQPIGLPMAFDGPQWQLAARYLGHALQCGPPDKKRAAYERLRSAPAKWTRFLFPPNPDGDALARVRWQSPKATGKARWCIATIATRGYAQQLDDLFTTLKRFGGIADAQLAVIIVDGAEDCLKVARRHRATVVRATAQAPVNVATKAALYSIAQVLEADYYLCCDTDILCAAALNDLRAQIETAPGQIVAGKSFPSTGAEDRPCDLSYVTEFYYWGTEADAAWLNGGDAECINFLRLNAGVFGGDCAAMDALDGELRALAPRALPWIESGICYAADELVFSLAVARMGGVSECEARRFNLLMYALDALFAPDPARRALFWHDGMIVSLLHFAAPQGKAKFDDYRKMLRLRLR